MSRRARASDRTWWRSWLFRPDLRFLRCSRGSSVSVGVPTGLESILIALSILSSSRDWNWDVKSCMAALLPSIPSGYMLRNWVIANLNSSVVKGGQIFICATQAQGLAPSCTRASLPRSGSPAFGADVSRPGMGRMRPEYLEVRD